MRTKKPLALPIAPIIWKLIVGEPVSIEDLEDVDCMYVQSLRSIRDIHLSGVTEANFLEVIPLESFEGTSCTGKVRFHIFKPDFPHFFLFLCTDRSYCAGRT